MQLAFGLHHANSQNQSYVVTIGNFDGIHRGHQAIICRLEEKAKALQLPALMMLFDPHPEEILATHKNIHARLTRLREKIAIIKHYSIDKLLIVPFNRQLAVLTAEVFVQDILVKRLNTRHLVVGDDFHFGKNRIGDFNYLKKVARHFRFTVESVATVMLDKKQASAQKIPFIKRRISSTWVRKALQIGDLEMVQKLLGRPYSLCGRIIHGEKRGRSIGIPTINIYLHRKRSPIFGVYAVKARLYGKTFDGVANIGTKPTVTATKDQITLEVHLFDFHTECYGQYVEIIFLRKLRDEKKFESIDALKIQIEKDIEMAKNHNL